MALNLEDRALSLDEVFFRPLGPDRLDRLRAENRLRGERTALRRGSGIEEPALLDRLIAIGVTPETLFAVVWVPVVAVAWADGKVQAGERVAILRGARNQGIEDSSVAYTILAQWLDREPDAAMVNGWSRYVAALDERLTAPERKQLTAAVVDSARQVASAAGGILGIGSVSASEEALLTQLEAAFKFPEQFATMWR
jgi:hypothetical protein